MNMTESVTVLLGVYLWDDSLELEQSTEECCTYKITETFEDFMNLLNIN